MNRAAGFSLIELMMVVTVGAVLAMVSIHAFTNLRQQSSIGGEVSDFMGQVEYARAEALRRGNRVSMCVSSSGSACTGGTSWDQGYIVFTDPLGTGSYAAGDVILRKQKKFKSTDTFTSSNNMSVFTFSRLGFVINIPAGVTVMMTGHANVPAISSTQCVAISVAGQMTKYSGGKGGCT